MAFDYSKLRGRIVEKYGHQQRFAEAMGMSERTLSLKLNNKVFFNQNDILRACDLLGIAYGDVHKYFFVVKVQNI